MKKNLFGLLLVASSLLTSGGQITNLNETVNFPIKVEEAGLVETTTDESNKTIKLNVKNAAGYVGNDATVVVSPTYVSSTKIDGVAYLRYATAIKGAFNDISYTRTMDGMSKDVAVTQVYKGLTANGTVLYYNGSEPVADSSYAGQYYWAVYLIKFESTASYAKKKTSIAVQLNVTKEDGTVVSSSSKTTSLEADLVMTATEVFGKDYSIGFGLSAYVEEAYTHAADDIYVKYSSDGTNMTFDMKGFGVFSDTEYVKVVLHNSLYEHHSWQTIGSDVILDITKNTIYKGEGRWNFWGSADGVYDYTNLGQNSTDLLIVPSFTQNNGWFQLTATVPLSVMGGYSSNGQIKAFFSEWDSGVDVSGHDAAYFPRIESSEAFAGPYVTIDNGVGTGDMAYQANYITLQDRTIGKNTIDAHTTLVNDVNILANKVTLTHNSSNGYSDVFATRDDNGISLRVEQRLAGGKFVGDYNAEWWNNDNIEFRFSNGSLDGMNHKNDDGSDNTVTGAVQRWICANPKLMETNTGWDKFYMSDATYNGTYWCIDYEMYISYNSLNLDGVTTASDTILFKGGANTNTGWCAFSQTYNFLTYETTKSAITASGFTNAPDINGVKNNATSAVITDWNSNIDQLVLDGSQDWKVIYEFNTSYTNSTFDRAKNWVAEVYSPSWGKGGATIRNDWCGWGSWGVTCLSGADTTLYDSMLQAGTHVVVTMSYTQSTGNIIVNVTTTSLFVSGTCYSSVQTNTQGWAGDMWVTLGGDYVTLNDISAVVEKGYLI